MLITLANCSVAVRLSLEIGFVFTRSPTLFGGGCQLAFTLVATFSALNVNPSWCATV